MFRAERCFLCDWDLKGTKPVQGEARTGVPRWESVALCGSCAKAVGKRGEVLVERESEWYNVRVREVECGAPEMKGRNLT